MIASIHFSDVALDPGEGQPGGVGVVRVTGYPALLAPRPLPQPGVSIAFDAALRLSSLQVAFDSAQGSYDG